MGQLKEHFLSMVEAEAASAAAGYDAPNFDRCLVCGKYHAPGYCSDALVEVAHGAGSSDGVVVKDSGRRREVATGSRRDVADGKGRYDLLQFRALHLVARQLEEGAKKYGERNWELGQPLSWYINSGMRHLAKHVSGYRDERHDVAAAWNVLCFLDTVVRIEEGLLPRELDDIGHFTFKAEAVR